MGVARAAGSFLPTWDLGCGSVKRAVATMGLPWLAATGLLNRRSDDLR